MTWGDGEPLVIVESARPRYETRYEYGLRWNDQRSSGIDLVFSRRGIEVGGHYDSFVGIQGGFIPWAEVDRIRTRLNERIPRLPSSRRSVEGE